MDIKGAAAWGEVQTVGILEVEVSHCAIAGKLDARALEADCFVATGNEVVVRFMDTRTQLTPVKGAWVVVRLAIFIPAAAPIQSTPYQRHPAQRADT
jgi:hypothetical protein